MTVFVPHDDGTKDFTDATRFGEIYVIRRKFIYPDEFVNDGYVLPEDIRALFWFYANRFDGNADYILPYGDLVQILYFTSCIVALDKLLRLLRYDRHEKAYMPVVVYDPVIHR